MPSTQGPREDSPQALIGPLLCSDPASEDSCGPSLLSDQLWGRVFRLSTELACEIA